MRKYYLTVFSAIFVLCFCHNDTTAQNPQRWSDDVLDYDQDWYGSSNARALSDSVLQYQSPEGGWPKSTNLAIPPKSPDDIPKEGDGRANSFDNDATTVPMQFLARVIQVTNEEIYKQAFNRGLDYIFAAQYPNGGWPQFWPRKNKYHPRITFNDGAMIRVLNLVRDIASGEEPFTFVDSERLSKAKKSMKLGIDCILKTQIKQNGNLTAWCAQYDEKTLEPAWARSYEPPSLSGSESVGVVRLLMSIEQPSPEVIKAVDGAVAWFRRVAMKGLRQDSKRNDDGRTERRIVKDPDAPLLWARFYELETNRPLYVDRDSVFRYDFNEISYERRSGYRYNGSWPASLIERDYPKWREKHIAIAGDSTIEQSPKKPRVIVTSDGEIDDECSMVRFLLYANEWDIEGIVTSSSQYHWQGHKWAGDDWIDPYLTAYKQVYPNLVKHDDQFPTPQYLQERTFLGNVKSEGDMEDETAGSKHIVKVLLDDSDDRPIWLQAWGGMNTIARALKTIEEKYPERMIEVAKKIRFYFIWEQDSTYQDYIRPNWGKYNIPTIVSDQFIAIAYVKQRREIPQEMERYFSAEWMNQNLLHDHGPLLDLYKAHDDGLFRSEGDTPAYLHVIPTGLRSSESPGWGGWGGRFVNVRENTWLDPVLEPGYEYPKGRWYTSTAWGRSRLKEEIPNDEKLTAYLKPQWRWIDAIQNDFASRADWCVKPFDEANHPPIVKQSHGNNLKANSGEAVKLSAKGTSDPDGDKLKYSWWQYEEADTYNGSIEIEGASEQDATFTVPNDASKGETIHIICEVTDTGTPPLTRYQRIVVVVE